MAVMIAIGQQDVYNFLKRHKKKWFSTREIADKTKISSGSALASLKRLRRARMINYKLAKRYIGGRPGKRKVYVYRFRK